MIKVIVFDIGETLVRYNKPLNWSGLYRPALEHMANKCAVTFTDKDYDSAIDILMKYNTRVNPREVEVSSDRIFSEIINACNQSMDKLAAFKAYFYSFFRNEAVLFPEVKEVLEELRNRGIVIGTLSDVAYGMDNQYALEDIKEISQFVTYPYTSNDIGYRKPNAAGLLFFMKQLDVDASEILFVGDEKKDMECAHNAGVTGVLISRRNEVKNLGQDYTISSLNRLINILEGELNE